MSTSVKTVESLNIEISHLDDRLESIESQLSSIKETIVNITNFNEESKSYRTSLEESTKKNIDKIREDIDNVSTTCSREMESVSFYNKEVKTLFIEKLDTVKERIEGNRNDLKGIRERDLTALAKDSDVKNIGIDLNTVKDKVETLPTLESIRTEWLDENSGLASKEDLNKTNKEVSKLASKEDLNKTNVQVSNLDGKMSVNLFGTAVIFVSTLISVYSFLKPPDPVKSEQPETPPYSHNVSDLDNK